MERHPLAAPPTHLSGGLFGVWSAPTGLTWAIGAGGALVQWDGERWNSLASQTTSDLRAIWGSGPDDLWAVGLGGLILNYEP